ncbi:MAG TPA: fibronectin type III domain-containing protein [Gaiellaceae bacterium]|nr:fibronectin type III domain-containing protein [Gaiellaceae bacterium]
MLAGATLGLAALVTLLPSASAQTAGPQPPANPAVLAASQDSITIGWGPTQPGPFLSLGEERNALVVGWGPSEDPRGPVTYTLTKDGSVVASGLTTTSYRLTGLNKKTKSFRTCVRAIGVQGLASPQACATWTRG